MNNKYYNILEFDKIIEKLNSELILDSNKESLKDITLSNDIDEINSMLDEVDEASKLLLRIGNISISFKNDICDILNKLNKFGVITIDELIHIMSFLDTIKGINLYEQQAKNYQIECIYFSNYSKLLFYPKELNLRIKEIITPYGEVLDSASITLKQIRKQIKDTEKNIQVKLQEILQKNSSKLSQAIISIRDDRYVIPVKNDFKGIIKGISHGESASGETVYIEPQIICDLNNKLNSLKEDEKREIHHILKEVSEQINVYYDELKNSYYILEKLDLIFGKASLGNKLNCRKPKINNKGYVSLIKAHHPLLNVSHIVSNDIIIGKDYKGIIITGPNTGGKTVLLKTIGLLSLMVKFGLLIPCDESSDIMIFDNVYADIGDEQSIDQNLSTFSSHLKNVIDIMNHVTENSLVICDELGSGTDPVEGSSLAIAIFDYLIDKNCLVIASSHYAELKIHAYESENIINASVEFDIETLKPTYKLLIGVPGESNALKISKIYGLPKEIIEKAESLTNKSNNEINETLNKLINRSNKLEALIKENKEKEKELVGKIKEAEDNIRESFLKSEEIIKKAESDANKIISKKESKIDELIAELSEMKLKEVKHHELADLKFQYRNVKNESTEIPIYKENQEISEKDRVFIITYNCYGEVIKKVKQDKYLIQMGNATITTSKDNLKVVSNKEVKRMTNKSSNSNLIVKNVKMSLDLRGMRYEEAQSLIDDYIYDAVFAGLKQVSIIHGFGTGVIRKLVHDKLNKNEYVESYRYGGQNEGGQGATIVVLKN